MKTEKGKCWFEVYRNGKPIMQDKRYISRKWARWQSVKAFVLKCKKSEGEYCTYDIQPYCPHKISEECCSCTKEFDEYFAV